MSAMKSNDMMIAAVLVVGAMMYTKRAQGATVQRGAPMTSLPGNVGTGSGQALGGALGGLLGGLFGGLGNSFTPNSAGTGTPDWNAAYQANPELMDNVMQYGI